MRNTSADRWAVLLALGLFLVLALFGAGYHWVEEAGSAERDGYVLKAEELLSGSLPRDPYRPLLYPLLVAALSLVVGDPFSSARLLSNAAAAFLAWSAYALGRRFGGPAVGGWAMALTAVNPNLWILGQHVTTDMAFAALAGGAVVAALVYMSGSGTGSAPGRLAPLVVASACFGLAAFTRSNALFLLPGFLLAWWWTPGARRRRWGHLALALGVVLVLLLPHWILRAATFGDPFYSENWKNLAFKLYGFPDWSYLERVPFTGLMDVVRSGPWVVVAGGISELRRFLQGGLAQLVGTWAHLGLFALGLGVALRRQTKPALVLVATGAILVVSTALVFFTWGRLLLVLVPLANALAALAWPWTAEVAEKLGGRLRRPLARAVPALAALAVVLLAVKTFAFRLPAFVDNHPYAQVAALQELEAELPGSAVLAGTSPFLGRYLHNPERYLHVPDAFGREVEEPAIYLERLRRVLVEVGATHLVVGRVDLRHRPGSLVDGSLAVDWLSLSPRDGGSSGGSGGVWLYEVVAGG